ncbi:hypothetical protein DOT_0462 [Desulfosporosinus sp. OT]|nr:hypothetical protein DOT_0462 [Desulfosporosinus sp. OT]
MPIFLDYICIIIFTKVNKIKPYNTGAQSLLHSCIYAIMQK